jgi:hypothetical protein
MKSDFMTYYELFEISPDASAEEIKEKYKKLIFDIHPDRNSSASALEKVKLLNAAYEILKDPIKRTQYDISIKYQEHSDNVSSHADNKTQHQSESIDFIKCSKCNQITAQPRYIIFYYTLSFLILTQKKPDHGIFCRQCADRVGARCTLITWIMGWWGMPWGPIYSIESLFYNLRGGIRPRDVNIKILAYQVAAFIQHGKLELAIALAKDSLKSFKVGDEESSQYLKDVCSFDAVGNSIKLKSSWSKITWLQSIQYLFLFLVISVLGWASTSGQDGDVSDSVPYASTSSNQSHLNPDFKKDLNKIEICELQDILKSRGIYKGGLDGISGKSTQASLESLAAQNNLSITGLNYQAYAKVVNFAQGIHLERDEYPRPVNGQIIEAKSQKRYSPFKVTVPDAGKDYYIKLVNFKTQETAIGFYVRSGEVKELDAPFGNYKFKYAVGERWLNKNCLFGRNTELFISNDAFDFYRDGNIAHGHQVTLIEQLNGNLETERLDAQDF